MRMLNESFEEVAAYRNFMEACTGERTPAPRDDTRYTVETQTGNRAQRRAAAKAARRQQNRTKALAK